MSFILTCHHSPSIYTFHHSSISPFTSPSTSPFTPPPSQAQKTIDMSAQKLSLLRLSLDNRLEEYPHLAEPVKVHEENKECPPLLPRPNQMTGTLYVKILGVEGLVDMQALRDVESFHMGGESPQQGRSYSVGPSSRLGASKYMTLPNPHHRDKPEEHDVVPSPVSSSISSPGGSSTLHWPTKSRRNSRQKGSVHATKEAKSDGEDGGTGRCGVVRGWRDR